MLIKAQQKYIRTSPRKLRLVADSVRTIGSPKLALIYLEQAQKSAAQDVRKVIQTAIANAVNNLKLQEDQLFLREIQVGEGPTYKRGRAVSRGRMHPIEKKTSHITVILETVDSKNVKRQTPNGKQKGKKV